MATAFSSGNAFYAQYDRQGEDSKVAFGIAGNRRGEVTYLLWESDPSGGSASDAVISATHCDGPATRSDWMRDPFGAGPFE